MKARPEEWIDRHAGQYRSVVTYLEMHEPPPGLPPAAPRADLRFERWVEPDVDEYVRLFHRIGDRWLWYGRLEAGREAIGRLLRSDHHEVWRLRGDDDVHGLCELDCSKAGEVKVDYCGLVPEAIGQGFGGFLLRSGLYQAWREGVRRVWLHTATEDHPGALAFYQHLGFRIFGEESEWVSDPRLRGLLPRDAGPHVPIAE